MSKFISVLTEAAFSKIKGENQCLKIIKIPKFVKKNNAKT